MGNQTSEDHARWLHETKGTNYGYGDALWPRDNTYFDSGSGNETRPTFWDDQWIFWLGPFIGAAAAICGKRWSRLEGLAILQDQSS
ncbi:hypothetical protein O6H91_05G115100 [Diphasiastrum complanatum]|uniref:Uncharacterized protein n=1 Tax=Diphasiastrum complanatum TaxID=34168 RepID=A0ACC2DSB5_DIPCM|nr:hypothetical protein O6H91_05G115100 [Diphasiastrum complanatum]